MIFNIFTKKPKAIEPKASDSEEVKKWKELIAKDPSLFKPKREVVTLRSNSGTSQGFKSIKDDLDTMPEELLMLDPDPLVRETVENVRRFEQSHLGKDSRLVYKDAQEKARGDVEIKTLQEKTDELLTLGVED